MITKDKVITKDTVTEWANSVAEWNRIACGGEHNFSLDTILLQEALVREELREVCEAIISGVQEDILQELIDCFVVISYQSLLNCEGDTNHLLERTFHTDDVICDWVGVIDSVLVNTEMNDKYGDADLDLIIAALAYCEGLGWDVCGAVEEVLAANWSKFVPITLLEHEPVGVMAKWLTEERKWIEDTHNKKDVDFSFVGDYVVYRDQRGKGKILKPSIFKEANIKQYIKEGENKCE